MVVQMQLVGEGGREGGCERLVCARVVSDKVGEQNISSESAHCYYPSMWLFNCGCKHVTCILYECI